MAPQDSNDPTSSKQNTHPPLRVCCYGSSSKNTKEPYIKEAYSLGQNLGTRGHTCVNGAGATGCMGAMNQGVLDVGGRVVGVIHEMFVAEGKGYQWVEGCHSVFKQDDNDKTHLKIVGGDDLQERKRMLVKGADALVVLPGGPGTFDELWEMVCARQIGLIQMPIVCVNVKGYYDSFQKMLERAHEDQFLYKHPSELLHFEDTSIEAIDYIERVISESAVPGLQLISKETIRRKPSIIQRMMSVYNIPSNFSSPSLEDDDDRDLHWTFKAIPFALTFMSGITLGLMMQSNTRK
eukprot:scaffold974_cov224-Chaetoceros_neogracile.AAC.9